MSAINFRCLTIGADDGKPWMDENGHYHYRYVVGVKSDATGARIRFTFTDSAHNYDQGKRGLSEGELLWAFSCFVSDAIAGDQTFRDFCADYGYDDDSITAKRIYDACRAAMGKFNRLFVGADAYAVANELCEMEAAGVIE